MDIHQRGLVEPHPYASYFQQMPDFSLPFPLHLHDGVVGLLDAVQSHIDAGKQVNDLLFAAQQFAVIRKENRWSEGRQRSFPSTLVLGQGVQLKARRVL